MNEEALFSLYRFARNRTIKALDTSNPSMVDEVPPGFKNTIRWNLGHILVTQEFLMYTTGLQQSGFLSDQLNQLFKRGTSPSDWQELPPTLDELRKMLVEQQERMIRDFRGRLHEKIPSPYAIGEFEIKTLGDVFSFSLYHEGLHLGVINGIKYALGQSDIWNLHESS